MAKYKVTEFAFVAFILLIASFIIDLFSGWFGEGTLGTWLGTWLSFLVFAALVYVAIVNFIMKRRGSGVEV